jgi:hypothetical protein
LEGFAWGIFLGPVGVLAALVIAANLDRERSDKETRELLRHETPTRDQMIEPAVVAALAVHSNNAESPC